MRATIVLLAALLGAACNDPAGDSASGGAQEAASPSSAPASSASVALASDTHSEPRGDAESGKALIDEMQCARCHDGLAEATPIESERHCFQCHADIVGGKYKHKPDHARWVKNVSHLVAVPSLTAIGERYRYDWIVGFLMAPHDLRPNMVSAMPRLPLTREQARDVATYLTRHSEKPGALSLEGADPQRGRKLMEEKACGTCHLFSGVPPLPEAPASEGYETRAAVQLAPDLRYARERLEPGMVLAWLENPLKVKPDTKMPETPMTDDERRDIAAYILATPLEPRQVAPVPALPQPLDRKVSYKEVAERLFDKTCRHCHGNPDIAMGDGGPGNSGGFGYPGRGLELTSYERVMSGYKADGGERQSVFQKTKDGTPRIVAALLARYAEEAGKHDGEVRGMPMGLPPVSVEDIQLLVTWIAQGRPRD